MGPNPHNPATPQKPTHPNTKKAINDKPSPRNEISSRKSYPQTRRISLVARVTTTPHCTAPGRTRLCRLVGYPSYINEHHVSLLHFSRQNPMLYNPCTNHLLSSRSRISLPLPPGIRHGEGGIFYVLAEAVEVARWRRLVSYPDSLGEKCGVRHEG